MHPFLLKKSSLNPIGHIYILSQCNHLYKYLYTSNKKPHFLTKFTVFNNGTDIAFI